MLQQLVERFDARASAAPDATAVVDGERTVTYGQLADLSSLLARRLLQSGAMPGDVVGLSSDRSLEWVVAMLAVLRIGGVYMPLPPDLPLERRRLLMREAGVRHVLRHPAAENDLGDAAVIIDVDLPPTMPADACPSPTLPTPGLLADRACVLFTSGTTGTPKGVIVRQSSIVRLVVDTNYIEFTPADVVAFASNTAFDAVTFEVWGAMLNGSRLVVLPTSTLLSPSAFETAIRTQGVTILFLTTELMNRIARARPTAFGGLKWLVFGGEKANAACVRAVLESDAPPTHIVNAYGPTECTTFATCHLTTAVPADADTISIGTPISGSAIHLLDDQLRPVPDGREGELCISGAGLSEGYLHRPDETAAAFTMCSIDGTSVRIYRTGDRARRGPEGQLEYIGRRDRQIKLRGFRIEPGEIEAACVSHPAVCDAVALVYPGPGGVPRLGACLLLGRTATPHAITGIRKHLAERLPAPMVPVVLRGYDAFPLTHSKKVDHQRLLVDLKQADADQTANHRAGTLVPTDAVEARLATIWQGIVGRPPAHADENFFEAGGDSLQAVDLQVRIESAWRISLSPSILIEAPTFRHLADHVRHWRAPDVRPVAWLKPTPRRPLLACVPGVFGHVFFFRNLAFSWPEHWGLCALPSRYLDAAGDRRLLTLEEIAEENLARLDAAGAGPVEAVAGYSFGGLVAYEMAIRLAERGYPPALILYDTASEGEQLRGPQPLKRPRSGWRRAWDHCRFHAYHMLYRSLVRHGCAVPVKLFNPAAVANVLALDRYRPRPYAGSMLLIRSSLEDVPHGLDPDTLGWRNLVLGSLTVREVAASHAEMFTPPHIAGVAAMSIEYLRPRFEPTIAGSVERCERPVGQ